MLPVGWPIFEVELAGVRHAAHCRQVLREGGAGLLLAGATDLDAADATDVAAPFTCFYAARPAADCATLLVRRSACASASTHAVPPLMHEAACHLQ